MSAEQIQREHLRITVLRILESEPGHTLNEAILEEVTSRTYGFRGGRDRVRTELAWLAEQGLVTLDQPGQVYVASLTRRGRDAALGTIVVPGVRRPSPAG